MTTQLFLIFSLLFGTSVTFTVALSPKCGISPVTTAVSHDRIVGGHYAKPHQYPWIVYIQSEHLPSSDATEDKMYASCEGSLIDDQWIVTAAHCFGTLEGYQLNQVALVLGAHNLKNRTEEHFVVKPKHIYRHGNYHESQVSSKYDITLVQLPRRINFESTHQHLSPICLPKAGDTISKTQCSAIGWGKTGPMKDDPSSPILKVVDHNLLTAAECRRSRPEVNELQVCAGYAEHGTCQGDSGGPLQCKNHDGAYVLIGVTSYGDKMCGGNAPAVFTNIDQFVPWIDKVRAAHASD